MERTSQIILGLLVKLASVLFKLLVALFVGVILLYLFTWYITRSADEFCDSLTDSDSYESVVKKAETLGYRVFTSENEENLFVRIPTQDSPFFRMACVVMFTDGVITRKEVLADD